MGGTCSCFPPPCHHHLVSIDSHIQTVTGLTRFDSADGNLACEATWESHYCGNGNIYFVRTKRFHVNQREQVVNQPQVRTELQCREVQTNEHKLSFTTNSILSGTGVSQVEFSVDCLCRHGSCGCPICRASSRTALGSNPLTLGFVHLF
jgi:hypothetical protein